MYSTSLSITYQFSAQQWAKSTRNTIWSTMNSIAAISPITIDAGEGGREGGERERLQNAHFYYTGMSSIQSHLIYYRGPLNTITSHTSNLITGVSSIQPHHINFPLNTKSTLLQGSPQYNPFTHTIPSHINLITGVSSIQSHLIYYRGLLNTGVSLIQSHIIYFRGLLNIITITHQPYYTGASSLILGSTLIVG